MNISFTKMHGLGNDFVIIDITEESLNFTESQIQKLCDRRYGIGCDQLLLVQSSPPESQVDFFLRIFNADGSEAAQCGNGMRCVARFVYDKGLTQKREFTIKTKTVAVWVKLLEQPQDVLVNMGKPIFDPQLIPGINFVESLRYNLTLPHEIVVFGLVYLGNAHAVIKVDDITAAPVGRLGEAINNNPNFPQGINVGFMEVVSTSRIKLRVYERGSGETLACGSGACAAAAIGRLWKLLDETVIVDQCGGHLEVSFVAAKMDADIFMKGEAVKVFEGKIIKPI